MRIPMRYTRTAMLLHWLIALLIACNVLLIWSVDSLPEEWQRPVIDTHKSIGITVLGLAIMRVLWRSTHRPPALPTTYAPWERFAAHAAHIGLYLLIFCLPLSGWIHDSAWSQAATHPMKLFGAVEWPRIGWITDLDPAVKEPLHKLTGRIHTAFSYVLYALFLAHVGGALKHQYVDKEAELQRMLPWGGVEPGDRS